MKTFKQIVDEAKIVGHINLPKEAPKKEGEVSKKELDALEKILDALFKHAGLDIEFTRHFLDRVNDKRNIKQIDIPELQKLFVKTHQKYTDALKKMPDSAEAVLNDIQTDINLPFVIKWNPKSKMMELVSKTVMRKRNFNTPDKKLKV